MELVSYFSVEEESLFQKFHFYWILTFSFMFLIGMLVFCYLPILKSLNVNKKTRILSIIAITSILIGFVYQIFFESGFGQEGVTFWFFYQFYIIIPLLIILIVINFIIKPRKNLDTTDQPKKKSFQKIRNKISSMFSHSSNKSNAKLSFFFELLIILILILTYMYYYNLFNDQKLILDDYAIIYYQMWYGIKYGFPLFRSIFAFSPQFFSGYLEVAFFTPGPVIFAYILSLFSFSIEAIQRIFIIISIMGCFILPNSLLKTAKITQKRHFIAGFYIFIIGFWLKVLHNGQLGFLLAFLFAFYGIILLFNQIQKQSTNMVIVMFAGMLMGISILFHFSTAFLMLIVLIVYLKIEYKTVKNNLKWYLSIFFTLIWGILIVIVFWIVPALYYTLSYLFPEISLSSGSEDGNLLGNVIDGMFSQYFEYNIGLFFHLIPFFLWPMIIIGMFQGAKRKNQYENIFNSINVILILFVLITNITPELRSLSTVRLVIFNEFLCIIPMVRFLFEFDNLLKRKKRIFIKNKTILSIIFLSLVIYGAQMRFFSPFYDYVDDNSNFVELNNWLSKNSSNNSRILFEDYPHTINFDYEEKHELALIPVYSGSSTTNGYKIFAFYKQAYNTTCMAGFAFNKPFKTMDLNFFVDQLSIYNVEYIIGWSVDLREFLSLHHKLFPKLETYGNYTVYNNTQFENNNFIRGSNNQSTFLPVSLEPNEMEYYVVNATKNDVATISFFDFPNWQVYVDNIPVMKNTDADFIEITLPKGGNMTISILWQENRWEIGARYVNYAILIMTVPFLYIVTNFAKKQLKNVEKNLNLDTNNENEKKCENIA
jgi:hypothetical protein